MNTAHLGLAERLVTPADQPRLDGSLGNRRFGRPQGLSGRASAGPAANLNLVVHWPHPIPNPAASPMLTIRRGVR